MATLEEIRESEGELHLSSQRDHDEFWPPADDYTIRKLSELLGYEFFGPWTGQHMKHDASAVLGGKYYIKDRMTFKDGVKRDVVHSYFPDGSRRGYRFRRVYLYAGFCLLKQFNQQLAELDDEFIVPVMGQ